MRTSIKWQTAIESPSAVPELEIEPERTALIVVDVPELLAEQLEDRSQLRKAP